MMTQQSEYAKGYQQAMTDIYNIIKNSEAYGEGDVKETLDDVKTWVRNNRKLAS